MLANQLREQLNDYPAITGKNFHAWAIAQGLPWKDGEADDALGERLLTHLNDDADGTTKYDAVLVDEAQDFEPNWFQCLLSAMEDPENGDLLIVADGCQGLYRRAKISWSQLGIKARGRTISCSYQLDRNYRNSREIIALAESFACSIGDGNDLDAIQSVRVNMSRCERSSGVSPLFVECSDRRAELSQAYQIIRQLLQGRWQGRPVAQFQPHEIAILYPNTYNPRERALLDEFTRWMNGRGLPAIWLSRDSGSREQVCHPGIKLQTIHSAKGLQYGVVILLWTDKLPKPHAESAERLAARRLLYVGMTRAMSLLAITASGRSDFIAEIASAPAVDVVRQEEEADIKAAVS